MASDDLTAEDAWQALPVVHESLTRIPADDPFHDEGEGVLYILSADRSQIGVVMAPSLTAALASLGGEPLEPGAHCWYAAGDHDALRRESPLLREPHSGLRQGHHISVGGEDQIRTKVPVGAGIYRILAGDGDAASGRIYVGQAVNLRRRLLSHEKIRSWGWGGDTGVREVQVLPVKPPDGDRPVTLLDLDNAEEEHIKRAREREAAGGPRVVNSTLGRNGRKGAPFAHSYVWIPATRRLSVPLVTDIAELPRPLAEPTGVALGEFGGRTLYAVFYPR